MLKKLVATAVLAALVGAVAMVGFAAAPLDGYPAHRR